MVSTSVDNFLLKTPWRSHVCFVKTRKILCKCYWWHCTAWIIHIEPDLYQYCIHSVFNHFFAIRTAKGAGWSPKQGARAAKQVQKGHRRTYSTIHAKQYTGKTSTRANGSSGEKCCVSLSNLLVVTFLMFAAVVKFLQAIIILFLILLKNFSIFK